LNIVVYGSKGKLIKEYVQAFNRNKRKHLSLVSISGKLIARKNHILRNHLFINPLNKQHHV
jgi:hypothetical protein